MRPPFEKELPARLTLTSLFISPEPKAHRLAYSIPMLRRPASVCCLSTISNIFSETACPIKAKFYVEPLWVGGTKVVCGI